MGKCNFKCEERSKNLNTDKEKFLRNYTSYDKWRSKEKTIPSKTLRTAIVMSAVLLKKYF